MEAACACARTGIALPGAARAEALAEILDAVERWVRGEGGDQARDDARDRAWAEYNRAEGDRARYAAYAVFAAAQTWTRGAYAALSAYNAAMAHPSYWETTGPMAALVRAKLPFARVVRGLLHLPPVGWTPTRRGPVGRSFLVGSGA